MCPLPKIIVAIENHQAYDREIFRGISRYANTHGPWLFLYDRDGICRSSADIQTVRPDGIIVSLSKNPDAAEKIPQNMPCIALGGAAVIDGWINIVADNRQIGRMAAEYLLSSGFKVFAFCGPNQSEESAQRAQSFTQTLHEAGCEVDFYSCSAGAEADSTGELSVMTQWITSLPKPIGIMAYNDNWAIQVLEACKAAGVNVPGEVAVVGVNNDVVNCEFAMPPLSSIALDSVKEGYEAAAILHDMMSKNMGRTDSTIVVKPMQVVSRQSTKVFAVPDVVVSKALDFIKNNVHRQIQVDDVAESVSVSRRELERRFKRHLNNSVLQEIKLARVKLIAAMLLETSDSISEIAAKLGFSNVAHIGRYFKDVEGISPVKYRKKYLCTV
jgi:LacI family transcriptional regulator